MIIAAEMNAPLRISSGPAIQHAGDLAAILSSLSEGEVLFLDEIHRMSRPAEEMLYMAMEDFRVDIVVGKGAGATAIPLDLPPFTLVGATTRAGLLPGSAARPVRLHRAPGVLRGRGAGAGAAPLGRMLLDLKVSSAGFTEIAGRSRGTPRIANRLLRRVRDWALVHGIEQIDSRAASAALDMYEVDKRGLDRLDRSVLERADHQVRWRAGGPFHAGHCRRRGNRRRWRPWPNRSWSGKGCWAGRRAGDRHGRRPGSTWGWRCRIIWSPGRPADLLAELLEPDTDFADN